MGNADIVERLRIILRHELADCELAIRARDPVKALNDLADASKALKSLICSLSNDQSGATEALSPDAAANDDEID